MPFLLPNQQRQSSEGMTLPIYYSYLYIVHLQLKLEFSDKKLWKLIKPNFASSALNHCSFMSQDVVLAKCATHLL